MRTPIKERDRLGEDYKGYYLDFICGYGNSRIGLYYQEPTWEGPIVSAICEISEDGSVKFFSDTEVSKELLTEIWEIVNQYSTVYYLVSGRTLVDEKERWSREMQIVRHGMVLFLDLETKYSSLDVGWHPEKMGVSVAVTYEPFHKVLKVWNEEDLEDLLLTLYHDKPTIIGFNIVDFDFKVLDGYDNGISNLLQRKCVDMLKDIERTVNHRVKLDELCKMTLGNAKTSSGMEAIKWYKQGRLDLIEEYCKEDVRLTYELYKYGARNGHIFYSSNSVKKPISVKWQDYEFD